VSARSIAGDWGTTRLRLFLIEGEQVVDRAEGPGIGALDRPAADVLREVIRPWIHRDVEPIALLCGMAGSRSALREVPYAPCPVGLEGWAAQAGGLRLDDMNVVLAAGLECRSAQGVPDVMRGEETQIFGALALDPALAVGRHLLLLPGTHSKWVVVEDAHVVGFQTWLTGELFALLRDHSILLRAAHAANSEPTEEEQGFEHGMDRATDGELLGTLFETRSAQLRLGRSGGWASGFLSGLLIAVEVAEASRRFGLTSGTRVTMIGDPKLTALYARALNRAGVEVARIDGDLCALAGLRSLRTLQEVVR
jgi:2-dehydro-3-deoxygalactonokinase